MAHKRIVHNLRKARYVQARWWLEQGVNSVRIQPRSKKLHPGYGPTKAHITDLTSAQNWFLGTASNLGVVLGGDAGLIIADWDDVSDYEAWQATTDAMVDTLTERTARGYHLFFSGHGLPSAVGDGCEFKARGVCTVSPSIHPSGALYRVVNNAPIARIDREEACTLFPFLSKALTKRDRSATKECRLRTSSGPSKGARRGEGSVIDRIKAARPIVDEMISAGVELRPCGADTVVGLCPFHDDHSPSLWAYPQSGLWGCNKPTCRAAGIHDVINFRALAKGISNNAAIRQLACEL